MPGAPGQSILEARLKRRDRGMGSRPVQDLQSLPLWAKVLLGLGGALIIGMTAGMLNERRVPNPAKTPPDDPLRHPQPGDVLLFYRPRRGTDYLIRWFTRSPFYHAALYAGDGSVIEARPVGVAHNSLAGRDDGFIVAPAPQDKGADALAWAKTQLGDQFDHRDFLVVFLEHVFVGWHINYTPPGRYDCAGFVTDAFRHAGFDPFPDRHPSEIDPADWTRYLPVPYNTKFAAK